MSAYVKLTVTIVGTLGYDFFERAEEEVRHIQRDIAINGVPATIKTMLMDCKSFDVKVEEAEDES